jgi:phage terminase large subunit
MKMVLVIFRRSLDQEVRRFLKGLSIKEFTEAPKMFGIGDAEQAVQTFSWPGFHSMIVAGLEEMQAQQVVEELKAFRDYLSSLEAGAKIPLRAFVLPCEQVL